MSASMRIYFFIFLLVLVNRHLLAQSKMLYIKNLGPHRSKTNQLLEQKLRKRLETTLSTGDFRFSLQKKSTNFIEITIFYQTFPDFPPDLYAQFYHPETDAMIDAVSLTTDKELIQNIELDRQEFSEEERIEEFIKKIEISLQVNPKRKKQTYNIIDNFLNKSISQNQQISYTKIDKKAETQKVFEILEENSVVTASRKKQTIAESPAKILVISGQKIEQRGYRTITEVLQDVSGFDFNSFHDSGEFTTNMLLRGIGDVGQTQILIMEDGIVQNDIGNGWMRHIQYDITMIDIERIEIILGPGSALYGANAYAGLINIITKRGNKLFNEKGKKVFTKGRVDYGSYQSKMIEGMIAYKTDNQVIWKLAGRYFNTPGDEGTKRHDPGNYFHNNYEPDRVTINDYGKINGKYPTVENDRLPGNARIPLAGGFDTSKENIFLRGSVEKENFILGYTLWQLDEGLASYVPGYEYYTNTDDLVYTKKHSGYYFYAGYSFDISRHFQSALKLYTRSTNIDKHTGFVYTYRFQSVETPEINGVLLPPTANKTKYYHAQSFLSGLQQQFTYRISENNDLLFGYQVDRVKRAGSGDELGGISLGKPQDGKSTLIEQRWNTQDQSQSVAAMYFSTNSAIYIQDEHKFWNNQYSFTLGFRGDYDTDYGKVLTSRSGLIGKPLDWLNFKLLYGEAFKAPTVFQLYDEFRGNEFLKPQKIRTYEAEMSLLPMKKLNIRLGYFFSQLTGLITEAANPNDGTYVIGTASQKASYYQNLAPTHIYGTSFEINYQWNKKLDTYVNYTFTGDRDRKTAYEVIADPQTGAITDISPIYDGHEIDNIAAQKVNIGLTYFFIDPFYTNFRMNWVSRRKAPITNSFFQPYDFSYTKYPYVTEGNPDGYLSSYTLFHVSIGYNNVFGIQRLNSLLVIRNLFNRHYLGMGRQSGNARRPIDTLQPQIQNPDGFVSPYHPQPGRTFFFRLSYQL